VGFGSNITVAFSTIKHCIKNNFLCNVYIRNTLYGDSEVNIWDIFLEQPFDINMDYSKYDYSLSTTPFEIGCWEYPTMSVALQKLRNNDHISEFQNIYKKYFKLKNIVTEPLNEYLRFFQNKKILGFHRRGRDQLSNGHGSGQGDKLNIPFLFSIADKEIDQYDYLFLTSDENYIYKAFINRYGNKVIFYDDKSEFIDSPNGLHYTTINFPIEKKKINLRNMLIETSILSKCDKMLLVNSNVSQLALFLSNHLNYKFYDDHVSYHD
jgi:hypothetical protein